MGLLFGDRYTIGGKTDNSTHIHYPDTIKEIKAPTDESIALLNEMQQKTLDNLIAKVDVKNNLLEGTCYCFSNVITSMRLGFTVIFKFKINDKEYIIQRIIEEDELWGSQKEIFELELNLQDRCKAIMLWYSLKHFQFIAFEQITGQEVPKYLLK